MAVCHVERPGACSASPRHSGILTSTSCAHQSFFSLTFLDHDTFCTPRRSSLRSFFLLLYQHRITPTRLCSNRCVMHQTMHEPRHCAHGGASVWDETQSQRPVKRDACGDPLKTTDCRSPARIRKAHSRG